MLRNCQATFCSQSLICSGINSTLWLLCLSALMMSCYSTKHSYSVSSCIDNETEIISPVAFCLFWAEVIICSPILHGRHYPSRSIGWYYEVTCVCLWSQLLFSFYKIVHSHVEPEKEGQVLHLGSNPMIPFPILPEFICHHNTFWWACFNTTGMRLLDRLWDLIAQKTCLGGCCMNVSSDFESGISPFSIIEICKIYRVVQKNGANLHFPKYLQNYWT